MKIWIVIAETLGTDGEFYSEVYLENTGEKAGELASSLVATMCYDMDVQDIDPTAVWEIGPETGEWFYRVRIEEQEV
jgi:hypothetical protein